jgi:hypothetical protein
MANRKRRTTAENMEWYVESLIKALKRKRSSAGKKTKVAEVADYKRADKPRVGVKQEGLEKEVYRSPISRNIPKKKKK